MPNFIDRRLNPKDKSLGNRQRFLRRAREELKRSIRDQIKDRQDRRRRRRTHRLDAGEGHQRAELRERAATAAGATMSCLATSSSRRATASRNRAKAAATGSGDRRSARSEDDFRFVLSREEVLDLFFEDLELPDMVKLNLKEIVAFKPRRAGFAMTGVADQHQCRAHHAQQPWPPHRAEAAEAAGAGRDCRRARDARGRAGAERGGAPADRGAARGAAKRWNAGAG